MKPEEIRNTELVFLCAVILVNMPWNFGDLAVHLRNLD